MTEVETVRRLDRAERRWLTDARRRLQEAHRPRAVREKQAEEEQR